MTEPLTFLDTQTQDELQPPCDADHSVCYCGRCGGRRPHGCDKPAARVVRSSCGCYPAIIACGPHAVEAAQQDGKPCRRCGDRMHVSVTPL